MNHLRNSVHPGLRGAIYYGAYWGVIGMFEAFVTLHFINLGFSGAQIGWLAAVFPLFNFLIAPPIARLADRKARRVQFLAVSILCYGLSLMLMALPTTFLTLLPVFALVMATRAPAVPLADSLVARMAERYKLDFGSMRLWGSIIFTLTSTLLGVVWQKTGFQTMFVFSGMAFCLVALAALLLEETGKPGVESVTDLPPATAPTAQRWTLPEASILFLLASNFLIVGSLFMVMTFGTVYMNLIGGSASQVGALFGLSAMGEVPGMLFGRRLARRLGDTNTLLLSLALIAISFFGTAFSTEPWMMLVFGPVRGLGFGVYLVGTVTIINQRAPENMYASYQGMLNSLCWGLAPLLSGPLGGLIYTNMGPATLFITTAVLAILAGLLLLPTYRLWRQQPKLAASQITQAE